MFEIKFLILRCQQNIPTVTEPKGINIQSLRFTSGSDTEKQPLTWGPSFLRGNNSVNPGSGESPVSSPKHTPLGHEAGGLEQAARPNPHHFWLLNQDEGWRWTRSVDLWSLPRPQAPPGSTANQGVFQSLLVAGGSKQYLAAEDDDSEHIGCTGVWRGHQCKPTLNTSLHTNVLSVDHVKYM